MTSSADKTITDFKLLVPIRIKSVETPVQCDSARLSNIASVHKDRAIQISPSVIYTNPTQFNCVSRPPLSRKVATDNLKPPGSSFPLELFQDCQNTPGPAGCTAGPNQGNPG